MFTYSYRLLPTKRQHRALERLLEGQRQLYNAALEERIDAFRKAGITLTYIDQCRGLTEWRQSDPEAASVPLNLQRWTVKRLDEAYQGFFRRVRAGEKPGFPRFRGKGRFDSFGFRAFRGIRLENGRIRFKGMPSGLRVHVHRPLPEASPALSDGGFIPSLRASRRSQRSLRIAQRALARKARGSRGRRMARMDVAHCHAAVARARANYLHQASARLVRDYDRIVVEKLNVKRLARSALAKDVHDASWAKFISMLRYKAGCAGARLVEVDPHDTSQECSGCGTRVPKKLDQRLHACSHCGLTIDRDLNAARNILHRAGMSPGLRNVAGCGMRAGGNLDETVRTSQASLPSN